MSSDPRGPLRKATHIEKHTSCTLVTLDCGHVANFNQIYHYVIGTQYRCFRCGPHGAGVANAKAE